MNAVIYARYSSDNQREESITGQIRECENYAKQNDINIVGTYIDRALSAKTDNRPNFLKMIKDSAKGNFECIIVWKLDRFSRNRYDSAHYKNTLKKNGVQVISATENISEGSEGILLETLLEGMAEYYSVELAEKVTRGMRENALQCKYNGGGIPIGYYIDKDKHFQIDPVTAPAVLDAFKMYANGDRMKKIADEFNIRGLKTGRNKDFDVDNITSLLHNRKYIGEYRFQDIIIPNGIPQIVPEELFNRVQERMKCTKKAPAKHKAEDEYILTPKLFCGKCKRHMVGESGTSRMGKVHHYYKCVGVKEHLGCDKKTVQKEWIENIVLSVICKFIFDDRAIETTAKQIVEKQNSENTILPILKRELQKTETAINNFLIAIAQGIITTSTKDRLLELEFQKNDLTLKISKEEQERENLTERDIVFWFKHFRKLSLDNVAHRRRLIDAFIDKIFLYDDKLIFTFNYRNEPVEITFSDIESAGSDFTDQGAPMIDGCGAVSR